MKLIGPFKQIVTLANLPLRGKISDEQLEIVANGGILINEENKIENIGNFEKLKEKIEIADKFILLATEKAINSKWCNWELGLGDAAKYMKNNIKYKITFLVILT